MLLCRECSLWSFAEVAKILVVCVSPGVHLCMYLFAQLQFLLLSETNFWLKNLHVTKGHHKDSVPWASLVKVAFLHHTWSTGRILQPLKEWWRPGLKPFMMGMPLCICIPFLGVFICRPLQLKHWANPFWMSLPRSTYGRRNGESWKYTLSPILIWHPVICHSFGLSV